ncbi:ribonuclease D [Alphaproteobacteria bacterium]|nr:ribonuclease D [Alphaproteobacteria bacterium]
MIKESNQVTPTIHLHQKDLPADLSFGDIVAVDAEFMGLLPRRDRLCLVQLSAGDGVCHLVQVDRAYNCPRLKALMTDKNVTKIFHFARSDMAAFYEQLNIVTTPVYCTKIASRFVRTYTSGHSLKDLLKELLSLDISKQQQTSDWGAEILSKEQLSYAATDVLYLHKLKEILDERLIREGRQGLAQECCKFLETRTQLDALGYETREPFDHS